MLLSAVTVTFAQERTVSGTVKDETGAMLPGVNVLVKGTASGTATDANGEFRITVPDESASLVFSFVGYQTTEVAVGSRSNIDVSLKPDVQTLTELVVTGYTAEKKADIIGSVAVVDPKELISTPAANLTSQLQGRASGVVVSGAGQPGAAAKVRIRGFTSFGNSDPLYVIDGVPTTDASRVNPNDIESIQVLKDATAASIYGARAAQGVIIITTKQGKLGSALSFTYDGYVGGSFIPKSTFPELLNTQEYVQYLSRSYDPNADPVYAHPVFGPADNFQIPDYIVISTLSGNSFRGGYNEGAPQVNPALYSVPAGNYSQIYQIMRTSPGTNWFDEINRTGVVQNHQLTASGGTDKTTYSVGFNYFNQQGTYVQSGYDRFALRANSAVKATDFLRVGENLQVIYEDFKNSHSGNLNGIRGEGSAWAQAFRMVPYIPVYDIQGGWGGNGVGESGNGTNPVAQLYRDQDDQRYNYKIFGNVFADAEVMKNLTFRTSFGVDYGNFFIKDIVKRTYERAENVATTALNGEYNYTLSWTWTNTLVYNKTFGDHSIKLLAGTEAIKNSGDGIYSSGVNDFDFEDPHFINFETDLGPNRDIRSRQPTVSTLASYFGRVDYMFSDKYLFNATLRRDGSSKFGPANRYAVFPAVGFGWRVSNETFMSGIDFISDLKLRAGWGQMGSERNVVPENQFTIFSTGPGLSNYDITRSQNSLAVGYAPTRWGFSDTKWETSETTNIGFDASILNGKIDVSFSYFNTDTEDLLVTKQANGLEPRGAQPRVNLGKMRNRGFEFDITSRGRIAGDLQYDATITFTHYKNTAVDIDGNPATFISRNASRLNNVVRTQPGQPVSSFYGYLIDGFFQNQAEVDALNMSGAVVGSWRYKDVNGDKAITDADQVFLGNPQPDFIMGMNLGLRYKNFDFSTFLVWNYGNELFNYTKYFTDMRVFVGGVSKRVLYESWTPENPTGVLPHLAPGGANGFTSFTTSTSNSYYVESGSYLRGRTIQIGYTMPSEIASKVKLQKARIYVQGQNFFTITKYQGADPDINIQGGDINAQDADLFMGVDETTYPNPRQFLVGLNLTF